MSEPIDKPTVIKLPQSILDRAAALLPHVQGKPEFLAAGRTSRATVLRMAMLRGLELMEAEVPAQKPKGKKK